MGLLHHEKVGWITGFELGNKTLVIRRFSGEINPDYAFEQGGCVITR